MSEKHAIRNHAIGHVIGEIIWLLVVAAFGLTVSFMPPLREALFIGAQTAGFVGWAVVLLASVLAGISALCISNLRRRAVFPEERLASMAEPLPPPSTFSATVTSPQDKKMVKPGWVIVEGTYTGNREYYWIFNNKANEYWPHTPLDLLASGNWTQKIYLSPEVNDRTVTVILAWVSPAMHSILESWKNKCHATGNWAGLKMIPPSPGHFEVMQVLTYQLPGVPESFSIKLVSISPIYVLGRGNTVEINYEIEANGPLPLDLWMGASTKDAAGKYFSNKKQDTAISLIKGKNHYRRHLTIPMDATVGMQTLETSIWQGPVEDTSKSKMLASAPGKSIKIVE